MSRKIEGREGSWITKADSNHIARARAVNGFGRGRTITHFGPGRFGEPSWPNSKRTGTVTVDTAAVNRARKGPAFSAQDRIRIRWIITYPNATLFLDGSPGGRRATGFRARVLRGYGDWRFPAGWIGLLARKRP